MLLKGLKKTVFKKSIKKNLKDLEEKFLFIYQNFPVHGFENIFSLNLFCKKEILRKKFRPKGSRKAINLFLFLFLQFLSRSFFESS